MPISTLEGYPRIGGVIGYGPVGGSGVWKLQERYALADDFYDDVSLLLKMNGANGSTTFLDSSKHGHAVTANGNSAISTTQSVFGGSSLALDGTGDYLTVPASATFDIGSGDFTAEARVYLTLDPGLYLTFYRRHIFGNYFGSTSGWALQATGTSSSYTAITVGDGDDNVVNASVSLSKNTWYHVAFVKHGSTCTVYIDGAEVGSGTRSTFYGSSTRQLNIGRLSATTSAWDFGGYIDSLRITKGQARYTAAFTPPQRDFLP